MIQFLSQFDVINPGVGLQSAVIALLIAGLHFVGHTQQANRSGYVVLEFDSWLKADGASVPIEAAATGLDLRPLKDAALMQTFLRKEVATITGGCRECGNAPIGLAGG